MFVGRNNELAALNNLYNEATFQMVVIYGRRRIGKTTLISEFTTGKPAIFFTAQELNDTLNLIQFSKKVYSFFDIPESTGAFIDWVAAFDFIAQKAKEQRFVLVIDEFPYAANANRSLKSILQTAIDHKFLNSGMFLILSGSQIGFMENEVLGYKSPLFGRRTAQIKLEGLNYYDAGKMLESFSCEDRIKLYSCIGGTPHYLKQVRKEHSFEENISRLFFDMSGYLFNEPMMLLQQELREPAMYNSVVSAIAGGATKLNDIAQKIGEDSTKVNKYLQTLVKLQIVRRIYPFGDSPHSSRKGLYAIADNCYNFWYRLVFPYILEIESGNGDIVAKSEVFGDKLNTYIGKPPFEEICLQYLQLLNARNHLPFTATLFGAWWGNDTVEKKQTDIDVIAANRSSKQIIFGECKWSNNTDVETITKKLTGKEYLLPEYNEKFYFIFTKSLHKSNLLSEKVKIVSTDMLYDL